ncbi:MAG: hypothetical protein IIA54_00505 [Chloroflexi bacterium]|nr:hypothetical protein [Chloroflexota bacterium]
MVQLDGVPATDSLGRYAHVRGIYVHAEAEFLLAAANPIVPSYDLRSLWPSIFLRDVTGHTYLSDIGARTILDDQFFRFGKLLQRAPMTAGVQALGLNSGPDQTLDDGLALNLGVGTEYRDISFYFPLTGPSKNGMRGLIPLAALQRVSNNALTIRVGTTLEGTPAGITYIRPTVNDPVAGTRRNGFDVWLDVVYTSGYVVDAPWQLDEYTLTELTGLLLWPERKTEYAWIRYFPVDRAVQDGQTLVELLNGITLTVAGFAEFAGLQIDDALFRTMLEQQTEWDGAYVRNNASQALPLRNSDSPTTGAAALALLAYRDRAACAAGPIEFRYATRTSPAFTRYVHRTVSCDTRDRGEAMEAALQCSPCTVVGTDAAGTACAKVDPYEPKIVIPLKRTLRT